MQTRFHGGLCCGIKHITGFFNPPSQNLHPVYNKKPASQKRNHDKDGDNVNSEWDFCWEELTAENMTERGRLEQYIDFLKRERPSGAIEVTLSDVQKNLYGWGKVLEELGFKNVVKFWNSNSGNKIYVYYLFYGEQSEDCYDPWDDDDDEDYEEDVYVEEED